MKNIDDDNLDEEISRTSRLLNIPLAQAKDLAAFVVVYRTLGIDEEMAIACMRELACRRQNGLDFDYEKFIEEEVAKMPKQKDFNLIEVSKDIRKGVVNSFSLNKFKGIKI